MDAVAALEASMVNSLERLNAVSYNLANANTDGFKKQQVVSRPFVEFLQFERYRPGGMAGFEARSATLPTARVMTDHSAGSFRHTGRALDLAIEDGGLFVVTTPRGIAYTRQGSFSLNAAGLLVTPNGHSVLGEGGEIRMTTDSPRIDSDGAVWDGDALVDRLEVVYPAESARWQALGNGLYVFEASSSPRSEASARIRQGYLETSNVVLMTEMVKMMETVRHFEAAQRMLVGYDGMLDKAVNVIGDL